MKYVATKFFHDLKDNNHPYNVGDTFPRDGVEVDEKRLAELAGKENKRGIPLIKPVEEDKTEKPAKSNAKKTAAK